MSGNTKTLRTRIKSVSSTLQLTKAMGLVASSKIRRANINMTNGREYEASLNKMLGSLTSSPECVKSPFLSKRDGERTRIVIIAGDRGLAGGYNANVFREARKYQNATFLPIGKKACERYSAPINSAEKFAFQDAYDMAQTLIRDYLDNKFDKLGIIYTKYYSIMSQEAETCWVLPFEKGENQQNTGTIFEPDSLTVLNRVAAEYIAGIITVKVRESFASEVSARRMAMDSAGKNAKQMISDLQLEYNRARQGAITQEITEIVAGSGN